MHKEKYKILAKKLQYLGKFMVKPGRRETIAKRRSVLKKNRNEEG